MIKMPSIVTLSTFVTILYRNCGCTAVEPLVLRKCICEIRFIIAIILISLIQIFFTPFFFPNRGSRISIRGYIFLPTTPIKIHTIPQPIWPTSSGTYHYKQMGIDFLLGDDNPFVFILQIVIQITHYTSLSLRVHVSSTFPLPPPTPPTYTSNYTIIEKEERWWGLKSDLLRIRQQIGI